MTRGLAAPRRRRQPVEGAAQEQRRCRGLDRLAFRSGRRRHAPHRAEGRRLAGLGGETVDAARLDLLAPRGAIDGRPGLAAFEAVVELLELLGVLLQQAAVVAL